MSRLEIPRKKVFEVSNPYRPITFVATVGEAAVLREILLGGLLFVIDAKTGTAPTVPDVAAARARMMSDPDERMSAAAAMDSFLYASATERAGYHAGLEALPPAERPAFVRAWHVKHRPRNGKDICLFMYGAARKLRGSAFLDGVPGMADMGIEDMTRGGTGVEGSVP